MEYTRSKGEHSYETFEGTPEEIAELVREIDRNKNKPKSLTIPSTPDVRPLSERIHKDIRSF